MTSPLFQFNGGVKPDYNKAASTMRPIRVAPLTNELVIPLHQSIGGIPRPLVKAGDYVLAGQLIGGPDGMVSSAVHASTSGHIKAIEPRVMPHSSGLSALCIVLEPDGQDAWIERTPLPWRTMDKLAVRNALRDAGIVGLGGAVFPSHLKVPTATPTQNSKTKNGLDILLINGAECEPFITCDDMQMRSQATGILSGAAILGELTQATRIIIAIEDNKPEAIAAMRSALATPASLYLNAPIEIAAVPTLYPAGGAKQLMRVLTGVEVPHGKRSSEYGLQCFNTGTAFAVYEALELGVPMVSRVVTVAGAVREPGNFLVRFGTMMSAVIDLAGGRLPDADGIIMGGPMMGLAMPSANVPVVKATNCILLRSPALFPPPPPEMPCIRCGECTRACPADLQPFELYWYARAKIYGKTQEYHLFDCIECGCCAYVCPSHIPLVDYYRHAKSEIWAREQEKAAADAARIRYEFRLNREERDKQEKAARLAAKTAETKAKLAAAANTDDDAVIAKQNLIAAAAARVREQQTNEPAHS